MYCLSHSVILMKNIIVLTSFLAFGAFANAQNAPTVGKCPSKYAANKCDAGACVADSCAPMVKLAVNGLEKEAVAETTKVTLGAIAGINHCSTCVKSGTVMVKYNAGKIKVADIEKAVAKNGLKVVGHKTDFRVKGLACQSCSNHLTAILGKTNGVVNVDKICHMSGIVAVTFDAKKTDNETLKASIHTTKYRVIEAKKGATAATAPKS
nr:heavy-metal-associated domain-containing protein [bacterium]